MISRWMRAAGALALAPAAALAFEAVDTIPYPSRGGFPDAYDRDPTYPTRLSAEVGLMYDSNVFRLSDGADTSAILGEPERSDTVMRYGVEFRHLTRVVGRQRVRVHARGEYNDYLRYNLLDHFAYVLTGEWLWEVTNDFSGTLGWDRLHRLGDLDEVQRPVKGKVTFDRFYATGAYRVHPDWRVRGRVDHDSGKRTGDRAEVTTDATTVRAGIDYVTPLANAIGVEARRTEGSAPVSGAVALTGQFGNNDYTEDELSLVLTYNLGAQLRVGGRLGQTRRSYSELPVQEFDGTTGSASVGWRPAPKLILAFEAYREPRAILDIDATHVVARGVRFGPSWAATMKLVFSAQLVNERRQYQSTADTGLTARDDTLRLWRFGAGWEPQRHFTVGAGLEYGERTSNTLGRDFEYSAAMANFRYDW
jgi:Putative beta-barrel porin 2